MRLLFFLFCCGIAYAADFPATSCSAAHIQAALDSFETSGADGDTVTIPAGSCTWTGSDGVLKTLTKSVTLQGAGAVSATTGGAGTTGSDLTVITDRSTAVSAIYLYTTAGKSLRVTGFTILTDGSSVDHDSGIITIDGSSTSVRVDHMHFYLGINNSALRFNGVVRGVVDHVYFDHVAGILTTTVEFHNGNSGDFADGVWAAGDQWGSSNFMFLEDCRFRNGDPGDSNNGARYVFRHNTQIADDAQGGQMFWHGAHEGRSRSTRAAEFYGNTFEHPVDSFSVAVSHNGGTLLFWGNTVTRYYGMIGTGFDYRRSSEAVFADPPNGWGKCDMAGVYSAWDAGASGPCMDAPARGQGDALSGDFPDIVNTRTGTIAWPQNALSPVYLWANTYTPAYSGPAIRADGVFMTANREYYLTNASFDGTTGVGEGLRSARPATCTAGPGGNTPGVGYWATDESRLYACTATNTWTLYYTPYTYPHPLTDGVFSQRITGGSITGGRQ